MEKTFVTIAYLFDYEDKKTTIVYAGSNYEQAKKNGIDFSLTEEGRRNGDVNTVCIEHWIDSLFEKSEVIVT